MQSFAANWTCGQNYALQLFVVSSPRSALLPAQRLLLLLCIVVFGAPAEAGEIVHTVHEGQNLGMIARRYHTTVTAILRQNGLLPQQKIYPGQKLRIEEVEAHARWRRFMEEPKEEVAESKKAPDKPKEDPKPERKDERKDEQQDSLKEEPKDIYARKTTRPGYIILVRRGEIVRGKLVDSDGRIVERTAQRIDRLLRAFGSGKKHLIDRRLLRLLSEVSDHFGGRTLVVVSGYRPYSPKQFTKNSRHNHGAAIDFRVAGVPEDVLFEVCRQKRGVGCGYYPTTGFVHMDVRQHKTQWVDFSGPGEAPRYAHRQRGAILPPKGRVAHDEPRNSARANETH
jgi:uncharacterized protein YcbK (DUF882 family)/LysM repeat protein